MRDATLGLDIGGSGAKAGVYDAGGRLVGFGSARCEVEHTPDGRAEAPIEDIEEAARTAVRHAVSGCAERVRAMAVASQGQTFVSLDERDAPLHPAILWYDARAADQARRLAQEIERSAGAEPAPYVEPLSSAAKVMWLRERDPERMARLRRMLLLPEYISYRLTGEACTDPDTAMSAGLRADDAPDWSRAALAASGIPREALARIAQPGDPVATIRGDAARAWGMPEGVLLVVGTNDQYAGALGAGNRRPGIVSETTGTCLAAVTLCEELPDPMPAGLLGGRFPLPRYRYLLAYAKTAGLVLEWFRREFRPGSTLAELDAEAAAVPPGSLGVRALPHFDGVLSPVPRPHTRGHFANLTLAATYAALYRALLESLAFSLRECVELFSEAGAPCALVRSIGGGARSDLWLQIKADVTGLPVERPEAVEAATLGAAMLAAVGAGLRGSVDEASATMCRIARRFEPTGAAADYESPYAEYRRLCRTLYDG